MRRFFILMATHIKKSQVLNDLFQAVISYPAEAAKESFTEHQYHHPAQLTNKPHTFFTRPLSYKPQPTHCLNPESIPKKNLR